MTLTFQEELTSERLTLRRTRPTLETATTMFKVIDANRAHLGKWLSWVESTLAVEDTLKYLFDKEEQTEKGTKIEYGIYLGREYIGNVSIFDISTKNKSGEIGYWLSSSHARHGYMTEAVKTLEKEAFENLELNRVQIKCDERNIASAGVAKKCGYKYEGTLRQNMRNNYYNDLRNTLVFSKLYSEYAGEATTNPNSHSGR